MRETSSADQMQFPASAIHPISPTAYHLSRHFGEKSFDNDSIKKGRQSTYASDFVSSLVLFVSPSFFFLFVFLDFAFSRRLRRKPETDAAEKKETKLIDSASVRSWWRLNKGDYLQIKTHPPRIKILLENHKNHYTCRYYFKHRK